MNGSSIFEEVGRASLLSAYICDLGNQQKRGAAGRDESNGELNTTCMLFSYPLLLLLLELQ